MAAYDNLPSSTGVQSAQTLALEPEQHKPLCQCSDAEILRELWRRKRFVELSVTETVDDDLTIRYGNEEGFWRSVRSGIFRKMVHAIEERRDQLVHQEKRPANIFFRSTEYRQSIWIIKRPTGGAIE